ncbi:hypothetical protein RFI_24520 [Reticulomyxa filosa]|uniref:Nudix hydrolase domain-containing protein n=1 Tax=Reticulomyxa filosa TaxID=46433 RepID=X6MG35_RETFI|nr:hypothetical protein RFI_24520 [Reticulomyxa filosa]|eukprot:ETO12854.1 hypothetical protein RFI_24520 [Reticulomyxa filosa]
MLLELAGIKTLIRVLERNKRTINLERDIEEMMRFVEAMPDREIVIMQVARHLAMTTPYKYFITGKHRPQSMIPQLPENDNRDPNNPYVILELFANKLLEEWVGSIFNTYGKSTTTSVRAALEDDVIAQVRPSNAARLIVNCVWGLDERSFVLLLTLQIHVLLERICILCRSDIILFFAQMLKKTFYASLRLLHVFKKLKSNKAFFSPELYFEMTQEISEKEDEKITATSSRPKVGLGCLILRRNKQTDKVEFVIGQRIGKHGAGFHELPGGHLEYGETWGECASREVKEETDLEISPQEWKFSFVSNALIPAKNPQKDPPLHYITIIVQAFYDGDKEPRLMEPLKTKGWQWLEWGEKARQKFSKNEFFECLGDVVYSDSFDPSTHPQNHGAVCSVDRIACEKQEDNNKLLFNKKNLLMLSTKHFLCKILSMYKLGKPFKKDIIYYIKRDKMKKQNVCKKYQYFFCFTREHRSISRIFINFNKTMKRLFLYVYLHTLFFEIFGRCIIIPQSLVPDNALYPTLPEDLAQQLKEIEENVQSILTVNNATGIGVYYNYVYDQQTIYNASFGYVNPYNKSLGKPDGDNIFRIASITKVFTDLMLFQMHESPGTPFSMNDYVNHYVDFHPKRPPNAQTDVNITFKMLGSHMAGLWNHPPCNRDEEFSFFYFLVNF